MCLLGCGVATGWGAVYNTCKVKAGSSVVVFGLGAVGLSVVQAAKDAGARYIVGVDINPSKFDLAKQFGCHECVNSKDLGGKTIKEALLEKEKWGYNYTFDCTGITQVMRDALEVAHRGFGESCVIGVAAAGHEISTRPFQLVTGRQWKGTAFGGWKSRDEVPKLVQRVMRGELPLDTYITHQIKGLENVNKSIDALHSGDCLRAVVEITPRQPVSQTGLTLIKKIRAFNGTILRMKHRSQTCNSDMKFSIYIPDAKKRGDVPPVLYYLSGLTCTDENALTKSGFGEMASKYGVAVVFPDTSPRDLGDDSLGKDWDFGYGAGFYVNATTDKFKKNFNMYDYITKELPELVNSTFPVDGTRVSITGHSMGGHGALICYLKNPGAYRSCSAFAPIVNPTQCPWGEKAFNGYLGSVEAGKEYDATELIKNYKGPKTPILIDVGLGDDFYKTQLKPENFDKVCAEVKYPLKLRQHPDYDHSYFFIASFMSDHVEFHAKYLFD